MARKIIIASIAVIGLPTGWFLASALTPQPDRVAAALALFRQNCLPMIAAPRAPSPSTGLTRLFLEPDQMLYADPASRLTVEFDRNGCTVSDRLDPLAPADRKRLRQGVDALVTRDLPMLTHDIGDVTGLGEMSLWMLAARQSPQRWGVALVRLAGQEVTMLRLYLPARDAHHGAADE